jgi:hypothetical protein
MFCRDYVERIVKECFVLYGGAQLDTPVFERKDILAGKYGEDAKLIFDLEDQGGEQLALRYDHTVPLARYLAMGGATNTQSKLWQVGKVYRRDNPVMSKGRMREFSQAVRAIRFMVLWSRREHLNVCCCRIAAGFRYLWPVGYDDSRCGATQFTVHDPHATRSWRIYD